MKPVIARSSLILRQWGVLLLSALVLALSAAGCSSKDDGKEHRATRKSRKFIQQGDATYLWGGDDPNQHFRVDNLILRPDQFHYGLGREFFSALLVPEFTSVAETNRWLTDGSFVLGLQVGQEVKAYPLELLKVHEVVNDTVGGEPIFAAYCVLADLGAVYHRRVDGRVHTFGVSGYTYYDPEVWNGQDGFVLWDRETESLWWPLIGKAVAGPLLHTPLKVYDEGRWAQTSWGEWKANHPNTLVLKPGQDFERPKTWTRYEIGTPAAKAQDRESAVSLAPRWGENATIETESPEEPRINN